MQSSRRSATKPDPIKTEHPLFCREIRLFIQFIRVYCFWICLTTGVQITIKWPLIRQTVDVSGFFCRNNDNQKKPFHTSLILQISTQSTSHPQLFPSFLRKFKLKELGGCELFFVANSSNIPIHI